MTSTDSILSSLNPPQRQAVEAIEGPLLVLAGPGSGKTRVITHRIAHLIRKWRVNPHRILAVTFTNKAAREMKDRLDRLVGPRVEELTLGTFHAICARLLRQEGHAIGVPRDFVIYDDDDQINLMKIVLEDMGLDPQKFVPRAVLSGVSAAKSQLLTPQGYRVHVEDYFGEVVAHAYERYQRHLNQNVALDFDDLLMKAVILFSDHNKVLGRYQERYLHVLVDEFQDTNLAQYSLVKQLVGKHRNVCVVGDPDQSIYGWRYADVRNILNFEKDYGDARIILLEQNYRSTGAILGVASHVIAGNRQRKAKKLWTENAQGSPVMVVETYSEREEAQYVASEVERLVRHDEAAWADCAVMYRTNAQSRALEEVFARYGLPYRLVGGTRFYQRKEIKDIVAYLRLIHNTSDSISLIRVLGLPGRGIGQRSVTELVAAARSENTSLFAVMEKVAALAERKAEEQVTPFRFTGRTARAFADFAAMIKGLVEKRTELRLADLLELALEQTGYREYVQKGEEGEDRWDNVMELRTVAREYSEYPPGEGLSAFLEKVSLVSDVDELDEKGGAVTFITLHQAKGLEFPVVFIVGMEEEVLPHYRSMADPSEMEEERRLCYVGVTRAERQLYMVRSQRRSLFGRVAANPPSRFLEGLPDDLVKCVGIGVMVGSGPVPKPNDIEFDVCQDDTPPRTSPALTVGDKVRHARFGAGTVLDCNHGRGDEVTVLFEGVGTKKLLLGYAPLEKV